MTKKEFGWFRNWFSQPKHLDDDEKMVVGVSVLIDTNEPKVKSNRDNVRVVGGKQGKWTTERYCSPHLTESDHLTDEERCFLEPQAFRCEDIRFNDDTLEISYLTLVKAEDGYDVKRDVRRIKFGYVHDIQVEYSFKI